MSEQLAPTPRGHKRQDDSANAADKHVGDRIRAERKVKKISQSMLANAIGVSFQQLQKYEKGINRVGAGRLTSIAAALDVPITAFFETEPTRTKDIDELILQRHAIKLLRLWKLTGAEIQAAVLGLLNAIANETK